MGCIDIEMYNIINDSVIIGCIHIDMHKKINELENVFM